MEEKRSVDLSFESRITYENIGSSKEERTRTAMPIAAISREDYVRIMVGVSRGIPIKEIEGISDALEKMAEATINFDRYVNLDGTYRKTPLKKPRQIKNLEFSLPDYDIKRLKKMKNPEEVFARPKEQMTIYRNDGSAVTISCEDGLVTIEDPRSKYYKKVIMESEYFLERVGHTK